MSELAKDFARFRPLQALEIDSNGFATKDTTEGIAGD
jgi:hypothetical protein